MFGIFLTEGFGWNFKSMYSYLTRRKQRKHSVEKLHQKFSDFV